MKSLQNQICDFLEVQYGPFTNNQGVDFDLNEDSHSIMACSDLPEFVEQEKYKLEFLYNYESINTFVKQFSIDSLADLYQIGPEQMEKLFQGGYVELFCHIYLSEEYLIFKKKNGYIVVSEDKMVHNLGTPLITNEDFHAYIRHYFSA